MPIRLTPAVKWLCISCFAFFLIQQTADQFLGANFLNWFALVPSGVVIDFRFWQLITYAFLHTDVMHLFLNLMMVAFIGSELEGVWGTRQFLKYYFFCAFSGGVFYLLLQLVIQQIHTPMVGASAGIYGLLMAYGILFGERVMLFMMLFPMKAKHFVWVLGLIELMSSLFSGRSGVASIAHLGGMVAGFGYLWGRAMMIQSKKKRGAGPGLLERLTKKKKSSSHLRLIVDNQEDEKEKPKTWH